MGRIFCEYGKNNFWLAGQLVVSQGGLYYTGFIQQQYTVQFEDLTVVVMKNSVFWDVTPCSLLKDNQHFGGTCHLHLHGRMISLARNQHEAGSTQSTCYWLHAGFLLGFSFDPEDGDDMFLQNIIHFQCTTTSYVPED